MATAITRRPSVGILGPPVLWSVHFLFVYVFVSLACLWGWGGAEWFGAGVIRWVVGLATFLFCAAIGALGVRAWRLLRAGAAATPEEAFAARVGALQAGLFLGATLMVGLPTLVRPACF